MCSVSGVCTGMGGVCECACERKSHTWATQRVCGSDGTALQTGGVRMDILVPWTRQADKVVSTCCWSLSEGFFHFPAHLHFSSGFCRPTPPSLDLFLPGVMWKNSWQLQDSPLSFRNVWKAKAHECSGKKV